MTATAKIRDSGPHFIVTATGRRFWPLDPHPEDVDLDDIAQSLTKICRWTGATSVFYSVAEHSIRVGQLVARRGGTPAEVAWGFLHDAAEAYVNDLSRPVKKHPDLSRYVETERRILLAIAVRFGLPFYGNRPHDQSPFPDIVKQADDDLLAVEARDLMPDDPHLRSYYEGRGVALSDVPTMGRVPLPPDARGAHYFYAHLTAALAAL